MRTVVVIRSDQMGEGDRERGVRILENFLHRTSGLAGLTAIVFYNSGVKLLAKGSPAFGELQLLQEGGVDPLPSRTCVAHYGLEVALGAVSSMDEIVLEIGRAEKVITL